MTDFNARYLEQIDHNRPSSKRSCSTSRSRTKDPVAESMAELQATESKTHHAATASIAAQHPLPQTDRPQPPKQQTILLNFTQRATSSSPSP
ncbi:hypothetical protein [Kibdelosporangium aridum]|nr:hypothetical protein [Kibdelosporangium aridum]